MLVWAVATLLAGALLSVQARMNGELSRTFGYGLDAALWSFGSGLVVLTLAALVLPAIRAGAARLRAGLRAGGLRPWQCFGGVIGACFVFAQSYAVPIIGVALFTIATVGGTTASAVAVDRIGLGPGGRVPVSRVRVLSAALATAGVVVAVGGQVSAQRDAVVLPAVLALLAAAFASVQQATNGRVTVVTQQPMTTTWLNFGTGTATLALLALLSAPACWVGVPRSLAAPWWAWFGGMCGIVVVSVFAVAVRHLGVLIVVLLMLAGQLVAAVALDWLDPTTREQITPVVVLGLLITVGSGALAAVAATRGRRRAARSA